jgi:hypothetical protein
MPNSFCTIGLAIPQFASAIPSNEYKFGSTLQKTIVFVAQYAKLHAPPLWFVVNDVQFTMPPPSILVVYDTF